MAGAFIKVPGSGCLNTKINYASTVAKQGDLRKGIHNLRKE